MSKETLDELIRPLIKNSVKLTLKADNSAVTACCENKFGGLPYAVKGDIWPSCPTCRHELTFISQIMNESAETLFVFYYCFECFPWGLGDEEQGQWLIKQYNKPSTEQIIEITRNTDDEYAPNPCKVISSNVLVLPDWEGLDSVSTEVGRLCSEIDDDSPWEIYDEAVEKADCLNDYATLLGGYPRYVQGEASHKCSECKSEMEFFAQIDSEDEANIMWGDVGLVYFFRCPKHKDKFQLELQCH
ncbi:MAG: DUF1963 domain-containing protein [Gammaproteobacteria bacterium]|nr:DUF1963 domain-containing protein [Gammaproteobacteria bacterium]